MTFDQGITQTIVPGPHGLCDELFELIHIDLGGCARGQAHDHMDARERGLGELYLRFDRRCVQPLAHQIFDLVADLRVIAVARDEDHAGVETIECVAAHEYAYAIPLVEIDDAAHDTNQVGHARLEELIAWIRLEHMNHGLAVVAGRIEPEMIDDALDLVTQQRNLARAAAVHRGCEQAEEAPLAIHAPVLVVGFDADVIEVRRAVNGRYRVRLGDREQIAFACVRPQLAGQSRRLELLAAAHAQDTEPAVGFRLEQIFGSAALQGVLAIAQEGEMVRFHPLEQCRDFASLARCRDTVVRIDVLRDLECALTHFAPVLDCKAHILDDALNSLLQIAQARGIGDVIHMDLLPGFGARFRVRHCAVVDVQELARSVAAHADDRMDHRVQRESGLVQHHADGVDQKRHVFNDHFHDGA